MIRPEIEEELQSAACTDLNAALVNGARRRCMIVIASSGAGEVRGTRQQRGPRRLGIVSDDPLFVEATSLGFRMGGEFSVFHCSGAARMPAEAILDCRFDAVLIDDDTGDALDLVRILRAQAERPAVFLLSAATGTARRGQLLSSGADAVISKSVRSGPLVSLVRETIDGRILLPGPDAELQGDVRLRVVA